MSLSSSSRFQSILKLIASQNLEINGWCNFVISTYSSSSYSSSYASVSYSSSPEPSASACRRVRGTLCGTKETYKSIFKSGRCSTAFTDCPPLWSISTSSRNWVRWSRLSHRPSFAGQFDWQLICHWETGSCHTQSTGWMSGWKKVN
jgi:hypothetical protein